MRRSLPLSLRVLLLAFGPICAALVASFFLFRLQMEQNVRNGLRATLVETQKEISRVRAESETQHRYLLSAVAENPSLKAGIALWRQAAGQAAARITVEDQLAEISATLDYHLIIAVDTDNKPIAAVVRKGNKAAGVPPGNIPAPERLLTLGEDLYSLSTIPINIGSENLGTLSVGRTFNSTLLQRHGVLTRNGKVIHSNVGGLRAAEIEEALAGCKPAGKDCQAAIQGESYVITAVEGEGLGSGFVSWSMQSIDAASAPLVRAQAQSLLAVALGTLLAALLVALFASRSIARPLTHLVERLKESERTGVLRGCYELDSPTKEVNELASAFNQAAKAIAESQRRLDEAYLEFTQTMAQTLDARDPYTAGHSSRVSDYACAIAEALNFTPEERDILRIGASLHDIGKIGIPDAVLQKPGKLTSAEFEIIKKHPVIGKRILEGVARFRDYLNVVELHHENHDGTGYPWGLAGEKIPLGARIVHVVDAYDAMTTSRPYRDAMPKERAREILLQCSGTQFDPAIVEVFLRLVSCDLSALPGMTTEDLVELSRAINTAEQKEFDAKDVPEPRS